MPTRCNPGESPCRAYLQLSSYSFSAATRERRHEQLKERLQRHTQAMPQSVIVFEDFDHMDCDLRRLICDVRSPHAIRQFCSGMIYAVVHRGARMAFLLAFAERVGGCR